MTRDETHAWVVEHAASLLDAAATAHDTGGDEELAERHRARARGLRDTRGPA